MSTKVSTDLIDLSSNTGGLVWAKGTTAQQPASAAAGEMRVDTTTNTTLVYNGTQWKTLKETAFVAPPVPTHFLVVAGGGGGGGFNNAGGGGAGGLRTSYPGGSGGGQSSETSLSLSLATPYNVEVGPGGAGGTNSGSGTSGLVGTNSEFNGIISSGGGSGGKYNATGGVGGSGGGGGYSNQAGGAAVTSPAIQGYAGQAGVSAAPGYIGGGAGGAGEIGGTDGQGHGGDGLQVNIDGLNNFYAGGGSGGANNQSIPGSSGGGGNGGYADNTNPGNGTLNTGGGGGGASGGSANTGGSGGSGVVILRYPTADLPYFTTTGTLNIPSATDTVADTAYPVTNTAYYKLDSNANDSGLSSGYIGQGGIFNGSSSYIDTNSASMYSAKSKITLSAWVNFSNLNTTNPILSGSGNFGFYTLSNGYLYFAPTNSGVNSGGTYQISGLFTTNQWVNIIMVFDGTASGDSNRLKVYIDGNLITLSYPGYVPTSTGISTSSLLIGKSNSGFFSGSIDQVRIFPTALSSSNIALLYAETSATSSTLNYPVTATALYELSGNANDTGNTYNGTATNVEYAFNGTATDVTYGNGRFNEAANFNGSSSYINYDVLTFPTNNFTFSAWANTNSVASQYNMITTTAKSGSGFMYFTFNYNKLYYYDTGQGIALESSTGSISNNNWYHCVVTKSSTSGIKLYLNGVLVDSNTTTTNLTSSSTGQNRIGHYYTPTSLGYFNGSIDQVRIFDLALAAGDVEDLYNEHFPTKFTDGSDTALKFTGGTGDITFLDTDPNIAVNYLVVAGGGGGGAGGGGGGGVLTNYGGTSLTLSPNINYSVAVGVGGAGAVTGNNLKGTNGTFSTFSSITADGGGGGGGFNTSGGTSTNGLTGGSGGGGGYAGGTGGSNTSGQGFVGGTAIDTSANPYNAAGGGGAGAAGSSDSGNVSGNGGIGLLSNITGTTYYWGGGGGGGAQGNGGVAAVAGNGGNGGGGGGACHSVSAGSAAGTGGAGLNSGGNGLLNNTNTDGGDGGANTGGGGGANGIYLATAGTGGSGVVILRYSNTKTITVGSGLTATTAADGTDSVTTFTAGTGTITFS